MDELEFHPFPKIPRLHRCVIVTEKIDGTNASVHIVPWRPDLAYDHLVFEAVTPAGVDGPPYLIGAASRTRFISPTDDNFGFAAWVREHAQELTKLGPGAHFGEWWGKGIQRNYGRTDRVFSLFNTEKWSDPAVRPTCCSVVPIIGVNEDFDSAFVQFCADVLHTGGSHAQPHYMNPEGLVVFHTAANRCFKFTLDGDGHKG